MDTASTSTLQVTGGDAAKTAKALRQSDRIPLSKLCAQIRAENYREWSKWERGLDFRNTMAGRYGLSCPDQESFTFATDGAADTVVLPVASYWRMRMEQDTDPAPVPDSPVDDLPLFSAADERRALAQDCAQDLTLQLQTLVTWCTDPDATPVQLENTYERIAQEIRDAEAWLGFSLGLDALQLEAEFALMALA